MAIKRPLICSWRTTPTARWRSSGSAVPTGHHRPGAGGRRAAGHPGQFFSYDKSTDRYLDITDMMNEPALGQEDMTVAESILPVLNLANAQGQRKAGLETDKYYGVQMFPGWWALLQQGICSSRAGITETPETRTEFMEACQKLKDRASMPSPVMTRIHDADPQQLSGPHGWAAIPSQP